MKWSSEVGNISYHLKSKGGEVLWNCKGVLRVVVLVLGFFGTIAFGCHSLQKGERTTRGTKTPTAKSDISKIAGHTEFPQGLEN